VLRVASRSRILESGEEKRLPAAQRHFVGSSRRNLCDDDARLQSMKADVKRSSTINTGRAISHENRRMARSTRFERMTLHSEGNGRLPQSLQGRPDRRCRGALRPRRQRCAVFGVSPKIHSLSTIMGLRPSSISAPDVKPELAQPFADLVRPLTEGGSASLSGVDKGGSAPVT
jgi:hypothetical protein